MPERCTNNGRLRFTGDATYFERMYLPVLGPLRKVWEEKGDLPRFYEEHYLPAAIALTKQHFEPIPKPGASPRPTAPDRALAEPTTEP